MSEWKTDLVQINKFSRSGKKLVEVRGIVEHWTANPGATDEGHAEYFDGADGGGERYASAHIFIDKDSATLIVPLDEVAYHANERACKIDKLKASTSYYKNGNANLTTIGVELCVEKDGTIHPDTITRAVKVNAELCKMFKLNPLEDIYRHYDVTGKLCPRPWVEKPSIFTDFKADVEGLLTPKSEPAPKEKVKTVVVKKPSTSTSIIRKGDKGSKVNDLQIRLEKAGFDVGVIDGIFGSKTEDAVKAFQRKYKLSVDGIVGMQTITKLEKVLSYPGHLISKGSDDIENTKLIQKRLRIYVDGKFGNGTYMAVRNFQALNSLEVDGRVGKATWSKLFG